MNDSGHSCAFGIQEFNFDRSQPSIDELLEQLQSGKKKLPCERILSNLIYLLGNGRVSMSIQDAADKLLKRDYLNICNLTSDNYTEGSIGTVSIPDFFRTSIPEIADTDLYRQSASKDVPVQLYTKSNKDGSLKPRRYEDCLQDIKGELPEKLLSLALKKYYEDKREDVLIFHHHVFSELDVTKLKHATSQEKDFIVFNLTFGYALSIEAKVSIYKAFSQAYVRSFYCQATWTKKEYAKSMRQVSEAKRLIECWFGAELSSDWKFVGASFFTFSPGKVSCSTCQKYSLFASDQK